MKKVIIALTCAFCLSAFAEREVTNVVVAVQGTALTTTALSSMSTATTYVDLSSMYIMATNGTAGTIAFYTRRSGYDAKLFDFVFTAKGSAVYTFQEFSPRRSVTSSPFPEIDKFRLYGTNTVFTIKQTVASTNSWDITLLYEKD